MNFNMICFSYHAGLYFVASSSGGDIGEKAFAHDSRQFRFANGDSNKDYNYRGRKLNKFRLSNYIWTPYIPSKDILCVQDWVEVAASNQKPYREELRTQNCM